jgi:hypothetical protein
MKWQNHHELWESDAEAQLLESRMNGFWNLIISTVLSFRCLTFNRVVKCLM